VIDTSIQMGGLAFRTPLLTGSGTFGYGDEYRTLIDYSAFGGIITKSISRLPRPGNQPPRICETQLGGLLNSIGLANPGVEAFIADKAQILPFDAMQVFISVVGDAVEEFVSVVEKLEFVPAVSGYELNLSCPNVQKGGLSLGGDKDAVAEITRACRNVTKRFISVKLTPHHALVAPLAEAAAAAGVDALTMTNTLVGMVIDAETRRPKLGNVTGGYSGPPLKPVSLAKVWQAAKAVSLPIWASGGITCGLDCIEFLLAGASGLQLGSVLFADPYAPTRILREMSEWCEKRGVKKLSDLIGQLKT